MKKRAGVDRMKCFSCLTVDTFHRKGGSMDKTLFQDLPQKMNLISDLFSRVVFSDRDACQDLVRIILGEGFTVIGVTPQYDISNLQFRSVVLDIVAETENKEPIHVEFQIENDELVVSAYQRSSDANLGLPADIYHLYLMARQIDLPLKSITLNLANVHIYENNIEHTRQLLDGNENVKFELNV